MSLPSRRDLLRSGSAALLASPLVSCATTASQPRRGAPSPRAKAAGDARGPQGPLRVGLVGCGGRGTGAAANALLADEDARLVAVGDVFADQVDASLEALELAEDVAERVAVPPERRFVGWDAYRGVIEASDVVILATPPHFRPQHLRAVVDAGRHAFVEKPVAVDAPGVRDIRETCRTARAKGLAIVTGLCYRYERAKRETLARIHDGAIGEIHTLQTAYNTTGLWYRTPQPEWSEMEQQVRNWLYYTWLSGDHIVEQHIHSLDKLAWAMGDEMPVRCTASGGRTVRTDPKFGNVYDHFNTVFEWANGVRGFSSCRQWTGEGIAMDVSDHCFGSRGVAHLQSHRIEVGGAASWQWESDEPDDMYQNEHDELFASIRSGEPLNDGEIMCNSTLMAIMARMAAYTGRAVTWEEAEGSQEDLGPAAYAWGPAAAPVVAVPGQTKFS